jgi:hypothetical protein
MPARKRDSSLLTRESSQGANRLRERHTEKVCHPK